MNTPNAWGLHKHWLKLQRVTGCKTLIGLTSSIGCIIWVHNFRTPSHINGNSSWRTTSYPQALCKSNTSLQGVLAAKHHYKYHHGGGCYSCGCGGCGGSCGWCGGGYYGRRRRRSVAAFLEDARIQEAYNTVSFQDTIRIAWFFFLLSEGLTYVARIIMASDC